MVTILQSRASANQIREAIVEHVSSMRNATPSEIVNPIQEKFPSNNYYEIKRIVKEMEKEQILVSHIIFGGLMVAQK